MKITVHSINTLRLQIARECINLITDLLMITHLLILQRCIITYYYNVLLTHQLYKIYSHATTAP